jgi:hypothetical protein
MQDDEIIGFVDESGDREHFTITPNFVIDSIKGNALSLYVQIKRYSGEKGECLMGNVKLAKALKVTNNTLKKYIDELIAKGFIIDKGLRMCETGGGLQSVRTYAIVNIWSRNSTYFEQKYNKSKGYQKLIGLSKESPKGYQNNAADKIYNNKKDSDVKSEAPFSLKEELKKLEDNNRRDINIIGFILEEKLKDGLDISSRGKFDVAFRRYLRTANQLKHYSNDQIIDAAAKARKEYPGMWTGETLIKILTK